MALETLDQVNKKFLEAKEFLKTNYPNGFNGDNTYPLYLFYDDKKGFYTHRLTSGLANEHYWKFYGQFDSWEDMWRDLMSKY